MLGLLISTRSYETWSYTTTNERTEKGVYRSDTQTENIAEQEYCFIYLILLMLCVYVWIYRENKP